MARRGTLKRTPEQCRRYIRQAARASWEKRRSAALTTLDIYEITMKVQFIQTLSSTEHVYAGSITTFPRPKPTT